MIHTIVAPAADLRERLAELREQVDLGNLDPDVLSAVVDEALELAQRLALSDAADQLVDHQIVSSLAPGKHYVVLWLRNRAGVPPVPPA